MLSLTNISTAQASTYYQKDDYYTRSGGTWQGSLTAMKGFTPEITKIDFDSLVKKHELFEYKGSDREKRAGYDLCFSVPKSVSLAMCNESMKDTIIDAHRQAVATTLEMIEANCIYARVTDKGQTVKEKTGNMICGKFDHFVSRNQDPQLHTHCVVFNETLCADGQYRAIDNKMLYLDKMLYGQIYRNELARNLLVKGYEIEVSNQEQGFFELAGIAREQIEAFSSRRLEIVAELEKRGLSSAKDAERATLLTRQAKEERDLDKLFESWRESIARENIQIEKPVIQADHQLLGELALLQTEKQIANTTFAFQKKEFIMTALRNGLEHGVTVKEAEQYFESQRGHEIFYLGRHKGREYYCTKTGYEIEQGIISNVSTGKDQVRGIAVERINAHLAEFKRNRIELFEGQRNAVRKICSTGDRFSAVRGLAGTGKTHMLNVARQILEAEGFTVKGVCFTGKAAEELAKGAKIESRTIHSHLNSLEKEAGHWRAEAPGAEREVKNDWDLQGLQASVQKEVWVVDEASLVDNQTLKQLMDAAILQDAKVVLIGDVWQMQPVGAGSAFANLIRNDQIRYAVMDEIVRQKNRNLLFAVRESVAGSLEESLAMLKRTTRQIKDREKRLDRIAHDFTCQSTKDRQGSVIVTATNRDRHELNQKVRTLLKDRKQLPEGMEFRVKSPTGRVNLREFSPGDKLMFLQNDPGLGVQNGQTGYIVGIQDQNITVQSGDKTIKVNTAEYASLDYGYVLTSHKAQGITEDRAFIHIDTNQKQLNSRNSFYVDISRARFKAFIYTNDKKKLRDAISEFQTKLSSRDFSFQGPPERETTALAKPENILFHDFVQNELDKSAATDWSAYKSRQFEEVSFSIVKLTEHPEILQNLSRPIVKNNLEQWTEKQNFKNAGDLLQRTLPLIAEVNHGGNINHYAFAFPEPNSVCVWECNTGTQIATAHFSDLDQTLTYLKEYDPDDILTRESLQSFYHSLGYENELQSRGGVSFGMERN
jgi:conjugative relaxase-like TrwC/TraI family protein